MKKVLVMAGSNSSRSINKKFAIYASSFLENANTEIIDLNDYEMPVYSMDREENDGIPEEAKRFSSLVKSVDAIIISFAEHNGSYTAVFKNILDWVSRFDDKAWSDKPMLLLATSPGPRGGASVLETAKASFPYFGAKIVGDFSLPSFYEHFSEENTINNSQIRQSVMELVSEFSTAIQQ